MNATVFNVPPYYWPYECRVHADAERLEEEVREYQDEYQLYSNEAHRERIRRARSGLVGAMALPLATYDAVLAYSKFFLWAFTYDDEILDERPEGFDIQFTAKAHFEILRAMEVTEYPLPHVNKYALALRDIRMHIDRVAGAAAGEKFKDLLYHYVTAEGHKMALRVSGAHPSVNDYLVYRLYCGGAFAFPTAAVLLNGEGLTPAHIADRRVRVLLEITGLLGGWDNDIYSHPYEDEATNDGIGAVNLLQRELKCNRNDALYAAVAIRDRATTLYGRIREQLLNEDSECYATLIRTLDLYHSGCLTWAGQNDRYVQSDTLAETYKFNGFRDSPYDASLEAPPYPSIAWWWDYDPARKSTAPVKTIRTASLA